MFIWQYTTAVLAGDRFVSSLELGSNPSQVRWH